ncbi:enoyl-CoA hydratase/isomerase family protein [Mesorhizobium sp. CAU 1741]|uniref:enoyl-CoA hydratase/isomerase family protein n=1 Tax=Mesorhizobium sp. CAU 1741 TaxID=3140366 RepID=UPI00325B83C8
MAEFETISLDVADGVATLTLLRPDRRNAIDMTMRAELRVAVARLVNESAIRACVVTGSGGSFCAGGDITSMRDREPGIEDARERMRQTGETVLAFLTLEKPLIAAVDGAAYGAGFGLALAADFVLATPRARFCASFGRIGLVPDFALHHSLPRRVGLARARELILTAREVDAGEALSLGIAYRVVEAGDLASEAGALAARFVEASPTAIALSKNLLNQTFGLDLRQVVEAETMAQAACLDTAYHRDAAQRFLEGAPPRFRWPAEA